MSTTENASGLVLTHSAGADHTAPILVAIDEAVQPLPVHRFDFPYRRKPGRRPPDRAPKLLASLEEEIARFTNDRDIDPASLVLGGRSMGGRMCSMAVADGTPAAGLVMLSYPLHPTGKPEKLRVDHFGEINVPCLFVMGTKDPFGTPAEFEEHLAAIPGPVTVVWLEGANHSPKPLHDDTIVQTVVDFIRSL